HPWEVVFFEHHTAFDQGLDRSADIVYLPSEDGKRMRGKVLNRRKAQHYPARVEDKRKAIVALEFQAEDVLIELLCFLLLDRWYKDYRSRVSEHLVSSVFTRSVQI